MIHFRFLLADIDASDLINSGHSGPTSVMFYGVAVFGSIILVTLGAFAWALLFAVKKKKKKHHRHHHDSERTVAAPASVPIVVTDAAPETESTTAPGDKESLQRVRRSRRSRHPMNPTLAETRGLPPLRDEDTPLPPMP